MFSQREAVTAVAGDRVADINHVALTIDVLPGNRRTQDNVAEAGRQKQFAIIGNAQRFHAVQCHTNASGIRARRQFEALLETVVSEPQLRLDAWPGFAESDPVGHGRAARSIRCDLRDAGAAGIDARWLQGVRAIHPLDQNPVASVIARESVDQLALAGDEQRHTVALGPVGDAGVELADVRLETRNLSQCRSGSQCAGLEAAQRQPCKTTDQTSHASPLIVGSRGAYPGSIR